MTILLISNVGTRDIHLDTLDDLPAEIKQPRGDLLPRPAADYLRQPAIFDALKDRITMPMIEKALRYMAVQDMSQVQVILFATDQPESTPARFRDSDSVGYANLIRDLLAQRYQQQGLYKKQIVIRTTANNPADYDVMYDFYREMLPNVAERLDRTEHVYLLIAGGTPQMNTMLLFVGSEVFGVQAYPIYVSPDKDRAATLDILRQIYAQALRRNLDVLLQAYAYPSALELVNQQPGVFKPWQESLLVAMFRYAEARRNIHLETAVTAFDTAIREARVVREAMRTLQQDVCEPSDQTKVQEMKLRETIYLAQIAAETGTWIDFLTRLHRFSEGCMQVMAENLEVRWSDPSRSSFRASWWNANRALLSDLGLAAAERPADAKEENRVRDVDRKTLRLIVDRLADRHARADYLAALADLVVVDRPIPLRNRVVHDFTPLSREEIEEKAQCSVPDVLARMRSAYQHAFGIPVPEEHPYRRINQVCTQILEGQQ